MTRRVVYLAVAVALWTLPAHALTLTDCDRTTHISHGGETAHQDLGDGRVMWRNWWSQEGTATDLVIVDCAPGTALTARLAEENMGTRLPFDRTDKGLRIVAEQNAGARTFATLPRIADALDGTARDIDVTTLTKEPCACAALYADLRGDKMKYEPNKGL